MFLRRTAVFLLAVVAVFFWAGCGDVFRPVANPILQPGGDPQRTAHVVVVSDNGANPGGELTIDVSGDTRVGILTVGRGPVHAGTTRGGSVVVSNQADNTLSVLSSIFPTSAPITITLPDNPPANPVYAASQESGTAYVAMPGRSSVGVISTAQNVLSTEVGVGSNPIALVETPDGKNVYVVNQASNNVSVLASADKSIVATVPVGSSPRYAVASSDSTMVFVVNQGDNTVSVINTATNTVMTTIPVGGGPNYAFYDPSLKRVYVSNAGDSSLSVIDASSGTPALLATVPLAAAPCGGSGPVGVTALSDGSRAYVANAGTNNVCVLSTTNNSFIRSIPAGTTPVSITAASDGSKVFVANSGSQDVIDIRTSDDTVVATLAAPQQDLNCKNPAPPAAPTCALQTPVFLTVAP